MPTSVVGPLAPCSLRKNDAIGMTAAHRLDSTHRIGCEDCPDRPVWVYRPMGIIRVDSHEPGRSSGGPVGRDDPPARAVVCLPHMPRDTPGDARPPPAVVVDLTCWSANVARMAGRAREAGVRLRPHAKTHKCPDIARLQRAAGAWGLSVAKVGEAESVRRRRVRRLSWPTPWWARTKGRRLVALADRVRLAVGADSASKGPGRSPSPSREAVGALDVLPEGRRRVRPGRRSCRSMRSSSPGRSRPARPAAARRVPPTPATATSRRPGRRSTRSPRRRRAARRDRLGPARGGSSPSRRSPWARPPRAALAMRVPGVTECRPATTSSTTRPQVALGTCRDSRTAPSRSWPRSSASPRPAGPWSTPAARRSRAIPCGLARAGTAQVLGRVEPGREALGGARRDRRSGRRVLPGRRARPHLPNHACVVATTCTTAWSRERRPGGGSARGRRRGKVR